MDSVYFIIFWGGLFLIVYTLSSINFYFTEKKVEKKFIFEKEKIDSEKNIIERKRINANVFIPKTIKNYYPILIIPTEVKIEKNMGHVKITRPTFGMKNNNDFENYGASEKFFETFLIKYFGSEKISNNTNQIMLNYKSFIPDFAYIDNENKIFLDIEIDEPYTILTKEPIHYIGKDRERNISFINGGWGVIRFSEFQIVNQPESCCKFISLYLKYAYAKNNIYSELNKYEDVFPDKQWDENDSLEMIQENYRRKYLIKLSKNPLNFDMGNKLSTKSNVEYEKDDLLVRLANVIEINTLCDDIVTIYQDRYYRFKELRNAGWTTTHLEWLIKNNELIGENVLIIKYDLESKIEMQGNKFSVSVLLENKWNEVQIIEYAVKEYILRTIES